MIEEGAAAREPCGGRGQVLRELAAAGFGLLGGNNVSGRVVGQGGNGLVRDPRGFPGFLPREQEGLDT